MLAIAARYTEKNVEAKPPKGNMWEAGCAYLSRAREVLSELIYFTCMFCTFSYMFYYQIQLSITVVSLRARPFSFSVTENLE